MKRPIRTRDEIDKATKKRAIDELNQEPGHRFLTVMITVIIIWIVMIILWLFYTL